MGYGKIQFHWNCGNQFGYFQKSPEKDLLDKSEINRNGRFAPEFPKTNAPERASCTPVRQKKWLLAPQIWVKKYMDSTLVNWEREPGVCVPCYKERTRTGYRAQGWRSRICGSSLCIDHEFTSLSTGCVFLLFHTLPNWHQWKISWNEWASNILHDCEQTQEVFPSSLQLGPLIYLFLSITLSEIHDFVA